MERSKGNYNMLFIIITSKNSQYQSKYVCLVSFLIPESLSYRLCISFKSPTSTQATAQMFNTYVQKVVNIKREQWSKRLLKISQRKIK